MSIKTLVIDDEKPARKRLRELLEDYSHFSLVAECKNGDEALLAWKKHKPDCLFLDIQMPGLNGFQFLESLPINAQPIIVFVTAYQNYSLKAFQVEATDYLLKPFDNQRFKEVTNRVKRRMAEKKAYTQKVFKENAYLPHLKVKIRGRSIQIFVQDINWIKSEGNYIRLITNKNNYLYHSSMKAIEKNLSPYQFLRIHRSLILNYAQVEKVHYTAYNNQYAFQLNDGSILKSGRMYKRQINQFLNHKENH